MHRGLYVCFNVPPPERGDPSSLPLSIYYKGTERVPHTFCHIPLNGTMQNDKKSTPNKIFF